MILLDAAPSNDEMLGFFIVFCLLLFLFAVAKLFGPHEVIAEPESGGGSSATSKVVLAFVVIFVIVWVFMNIGTTPY